LKNKSDRLDLPKAKPTFDGALGGDLEKNLLEAFFETRCCATKLDFRLKL